MNIDSLCYESDPNLEVEVSASWIMTPLQRYFPRPSLWKLIVTLCGQKQTDYFVVEIKPSMLRWVLTTTVCILVSGRWREIRHKQKRRRQCNQKDRNWSHVNTSQVMLPAARHRQASGRSRVCITPWVWPSTTEFRILTSRTMRE